MIPFDSPENIRKPGFLMFWEGSKRKIGKKWVNIEHAMATEMATGASGAH